MVVTLVTQHCKPAFIPLALLYLKASLVEHGRIPADQVNVLEFHPSDSVDIIEDQIVASNPELLGLSCYVWNIRNLMEVARRVKAKLPNVRIVLGGPEVGPLASVTLERYSWIDIVVKSEGEIPLCEIATALAGGRPLDEVSGICFRRGESLVDTGEATLVKDLNVYPSPHLTRYVDYTGRIICVETQRGCVFRCSFCFYNKDYSLRNRRFDLDRVKEEILFWLQQDIKELYLMDPVFNLNADRAREICRFIAEHNPRKIPIHAEIWAEFVDDEMARLMKAAHFGYLEVGLQTTDTTALATVERRLKLQKFIDGIEHLRRHKLVFEVQLIFGLPGETRKAFRSSLNFAMSLDPSELAVFSLMVLPGTELWKSAEALRLEFEPAPPYRAISHMTMGAEDFEYGRQVTDASNALSAWRAARLLARERGLSYADLVDKWIAWAPGTSDSPPRQRVEQFITHVCEEAQIPADFYRHVIRLEADPPPAPRPPLA